MIQHPLVIDHSMANSKCKKVLRITTARHFNVENPPTKAMNKYTPNTMKTHRNKPMDHWGNNDIHFEY